MLNDGQDERLLHVCGGTEDNTIVLASDSRPGMLYIHYEARIAASAGEEPSRGERLGLLHLINRPWDNRPTFWSLF